MENFTLRLPYREDKAWGFAALAAFVVPLIFTYYMTDNFETIKLSVWLVCTGLALAVLLLRRNEGEKKFSILYAPIPYAALAVFLLAAFVSFAFSPDKNLSFFGLFPRYTNSVVFFLTWATYLMVILACCDYMKWRTLTKILVIDGVIVALLGLAQGFGLIYYESLESRGIMRAPGLLGNPNFTSMLLVQIFPFAMWQAIESKTTKARLYYGIGAFLMVVGVLASTSRGSLFALVAVAVVGALAAFASRLSKRTILAASVFLLVTIGLAAAIFSIGRPETLEQVAERSVDQNIETRLYAWDTARQAIAEHPLTGVGLGAFQIFYEKHRTSNVSAEVNNFDDAHNVVLQMGATGGIPLALSFLILLGIGAYFGAKDVLKGEYAALAPTASVIAFLAAGSFTPVAAPSYLVLALAVAGLLIPHLKAIKIRFPYVLKVTFVAIGALMAVWGIAITASNVMFYQSRVAYLEGKYEKSLAWADRAVSLNPWMQIYRQYQVGSRLQLSQENGQLDQDVQKIISMHPHSVTSYDLAANLYYVQFRNTRKADPFYKAVDNLQKANDLEPYQAARFLKLAIYYYDANKLDESKENAKAALALNEKQLSGWILLAKIYQIQNNRPAVIFSLDKALRLFPETTQTQYLLQIAKSEADISAVPLSLSFQEGVLE